MKNLIRTISIICILLIASCSKNQDVLTVYMPSEYIWLFKSGLISKFEADNDVKVKGIYFEGSSKIVVRLSLEKEYPKADIVMGLNQVSFLEADKLNLLEPYRPATYTKIKAPGNTISPEFKATMFDFGGLAFIYDPEKIKIPLKSFEDITKLKKSIVMPDPRTSTTGQDFLFWTIAVYGNNWLDYWKRLKGAIITITPDWNSCFAKFETGEAAMMVSYASDEAFSIYTYKSDKYKVFIPEEGGYMEIEANALVRKKDINDKARKFIDFCLTDEVQQAIPLNNWMMPVTDVKLPEVFKYYRNPEKYKHIPNEELAADLQIWMNKWTELMTY
ncbi:MAG TPA: thiamine ABC transporter substrate-binding protein [Lentisphaeria bacterium]|nr:MAG: hypothetical protein A2X47_13190 [Lentisphaerae bacterium GWF2_38_69]HBM15993.1 thiamine ABC transporter substrate-binding protein [Lentisphaeria bacterium]